MGRLLKTKNARAGFKANHDNHYKALAHVEAVLKTMGLHYVKKPRNTRVNYKSFDLVITVGGDGTVLEAARNLTASQILLGVNSDPSWSVGQFCHATAESFERMLGQILRRSAKTIRLQKMKVTLKHGKTKRLFECLNDVLVCHANPAAMSRYGVSIGREEEEQRSSGMWIASAAGSTGGIFSAGGRRLPVDDRRLQYHPRELYRAKGIKYALTGGFIRPGKTISLTSHMSNGRIFVDGSHVSYPFIYGQKIEITASSNYVNLIHG